MRSTRILMMVCAAVMPALANLPAFDNTGNSLLNGTYYFREVIYQVGDNGGDLGAEYAAFGTITFNGAGGYTTGAATFNQCASSGCGSQALTATSGTSTFSASGYGYFTDPLSSSIVNYGLISNNTLIASATESGYNTLFIATLITSPVPTVSSFQGNYQMVGFIPGTGSASSAADTSFTLNPDGAGNLGSFNISGYFAGGASTVYNQSVSSLKYTFSNGAGVLNFPNNSNANFFPGVVYLYVSPDRNFVFGGSPGGFDMIVGTKNSGGTPNFSGIYYEAGLDWDATQLATNGASMDTYYGSYNAVNGNIIGHERLFYGLSQSTDGFNYNSTYPSAISGNTYTVTSAPYGTQYFFGNNGAIRIGFGIGPSLALSVGLQAPTMTGSGVYLNPQGVVNAASYTPFTAGVSPGEIVVLYGTDLAPSFQAASSLPLPTSLNGVQVTVNGVPAPFYYVSPTQISVVIPYSAYYTVSSGFPIARIVVTNSSGTSNAVTELFNLTTPGVFTQNATGLGAPSVYHATAQGFVAVTNSNPAQPGETVVAYLSGLGATVPSVTEGTAASASPLANTVNGFDVLVGGVEVCGAESNATPCPYVGLAPYLANVYQFNIPIPSTQVSGTTTLEFFGPDSDNYQVAIPVGAGTVSALDRSEAAPEQTPLPIHRRAVKPSGKARPLPCMNTDKSCNSAVSQM